MPMTDTLREIDRLFRVAAANAAGAGASAGAFPGARTARKLAAVGALATAAAVHAQAPMVVYVDDDAPPDGNGSSWSAAFRDLQDALAVVGSRRGEYPAVVKVAQGVYTPDRGTGDRASSFAVSSGVTLMGGFAGFAAADPDARDPGAFVTVLSGDLQHDDGPGFTGTGENSFHVVDQRLAGSEYNTIPVIDGVTISGGNALDAGVFGDSGGGIAMSGPFGVKLVGCRLTRNQAVNGGAAACGSLGEAWTGCLFDDNFASSHGGAVTSQETPLVIGCRFVNNRAADGGAIYGGINAIGCRFLHNTASGAGGAVHCPSGGIYVGCSLLAGNVADRGGALSVETLQTTFVVATTVADNSARIAGAAVEVGPVVCYGSIFWNNQSPGAEIVLHGQGDRFGYDVEHCIVQGGAAAIRRDAGAMIVSHDVLSASPKFVDPAGPDGDSGTVDDNDYRLSASSPAIDFGAAMFHYTADVDAFGQFPIDLSGAPRIHDDPGTPNLGVGESTALDMGPYEFQGTSCRADYDASGVVGVGDVFAFLHDWFVVSPDADFNRSGVTDLADLFDMLAAYFAGCP